MTPIYDRLHKPGVSGSGIISVPTVSVHVVIAGVPFAVTVSIPLVSIFHHAAVITGVAVVVLVTVFLVHVGL